VKWQKRGIYDHGDSRFGDVLVRSWKISLLLLAGSIMMSALFWMIGLPFFFIFLFVPLLSFLSGRRKTRRCPVCGWETVGSGLFCPYNATPLEDSGSSEKRKDD
jgi:hypothetical protein